jgi:hypothetical protein
MRRALAISLILFFSIGPLSALLGESDDPSVPACCRRHGVHHCADSMRLASLIDAASGNPVVRTPLSCPLFPSSLAATTSTPHALAAAPLSMPSLLAKLRSPIAAHTSARISQIRARDGRGPPASILD